MWFDIVQVTPDGPEHVSGVHGLGGRLIRTIGSWNHGGVGGLAIKALSLLVIPHAELFYLHVRPRYKRCFAVPWSSETSQAENNVSTKNNPRYKTITVNSSRVYDLQIQSTNTTSSSPSSPAPFLPSRCARILLGRVLNDLERSRLFSWQCPYFTVSGCRM